MVFFVVYQQLENHLLQPVIFSRTVKLNPLTVIVAILVVVELAGMLGALLAIPVAEHHPGDHPRRLGPPPRGAQGRAHHGGGRAWAGAGPTGHDPGLSRRSDPRATGGAPRPRGASPFRRTHHLREAFTIAPPRWSGAAAWPSRGRAGLSA